MRIQFNVALVLLLFYGLCASADSPAGSEASETPKDYRFTSGQSALNIPFDEDDGHIDLKVRINHSDPCRFGLDTGAIRSVVDTRTAQTLGLRIEGSQRVGGAGGTEEAGIIKHLALQLPGAELLDQTEARNAGHRDLHYRAHFVVLGSVRMMQVRLDWLHEVTKALGLSAPASRR